MSGKVAVVTGSNKGIGYAIVRELCRRGVGVVYLTSRDKKRGEEAIAQLKQEGFNPLLAQLEVTDKNSVKALADHIKQKHGGLDILVNNAGVMVAKLREITYEDSKRVIEANYNSILIIQEYLYPVLKDNARVINISSDCGHISNITNDHWIKKLTSNNLQLKDINEFVNWFLDSVKNNTLKEEDFVEMPMLAYRISKVALTALTKVQQKEIGRNISINALHPGFVQTAMTKGVGYLTMEESSKAPAYLALDADQSLKGKYIWFDKTEKDWADASQKLHCKFEFFEKELVENNLL